MAFLLVNSLAAPWRIPAQMHNQAKSAKNPDKKLLFFARKFFGFLKITVDNLLALLYNDIMYQNGILRPDTSWLWILIQFATVDLCKKSIDF